MIKFYLKGESSLALHSPGQPELELLPYRGNKFNLRNLPNYSVEFIKDEKVGVIELVFKQPNGIFRAARKS